GVGAWSAGGRASPPASQHPERTGLLRRAHSALPGARSRPPSALVPRAAAGFLESASSHGAFAQRRRDRGGGGGCGSGRSPGGIVVQRGGRAGSREEGAPARRHPLHALPGGCHLSLPQHFRAGIGYIRLGIHCAVWGTHRPPGQARVLRLLAEYRCGPHSGAHGHRYGGLDHEHLLGHGHGHPCQVQGSGYPTTAVSLQDLRGKSRVL
ncbi:mCG6213, partial [Mus musculus]